jgi:hypothetical protein
VGPTLAPLGIGVAVATLGASAIALSRPESVAAFATDHTIFVVGAGAIAALGVVLAGIAALALRR